MDDKWLYNLKKRSENFERKVPDGLWEGIEQALGKQQDVVGNRKRIVPLWPRRLAVAAAVAVVVTVGFFALMDTEQTQQSVDKANSEIFGNNVVRSRENMEVKESSLIAEVDESGKVLTCKTVGASDLLPVAEQDSVLVGDSLFLLLRDSLIPLPAVQEERSVRD